MSVTYNSSDFAIDPVLSPMRKQVECAVSGPVYRRDARLYWLVDYRTRFWAEMRRKQKRTHHAISNNNPPLAQKTPWVNLKRRSTNTNNIIVVNRSSQSPPVATRGSWESKRIRYTDQYIYIYTYIHIYTPMYILIYVLLSSPLPSLHDARECVRVCTGRVCGVYKIRNVGGSGGRCTGVVQNENRFAVHNGSTVFFFSSSNSRRTHARATLPRIHTVVVVVVISASRPLVVVVATVGRLNRELCCYTFYLVPDRYDNLHFLHTIRWVRLKRITLSSNMVHTRLRVHSTANGEKRSVVLSAIQRILHQCPLL